MMRCLIRIKKCHFSAGPVGLYNPEHPEFTNRKAKDEAQNQSLSHTISLQYELFSNPKVYFNKTQKPILSKSWLISTFLKDHPLRWLRLKASNTTSQRFQKTQFGCITPTTSSNSTEALEHWKPQYSLW